MKLLLCHIWCASLKLKQPQLFSDEAAKHLWPYPAQKIPNPNPIDAPNPLWVVLASNLSLSLSDVSIKNQTFDHHHQFYCIIAFRYFDILLPMSSALYCLIRLRWLCFALICYAIGLDFFVLKQIANFCESSKYQLFISLSFVVLSAR
jgi:hypothetical protein